MDQIYQDIRKNVNDLDTRFWDSFEEYLRKSYRKSSVRCRLLYAKQYCHVLIEENARDLLALTCNKKLQVMKLCLLIQISEML
ncbi:MAG TPA: hypothetical protein VE595_04100 [Nitrososphaeraceae archaeon]|nr:hypothetical protein [Nitrososphaeraceae archaeon]